MIFLKHQKVTREKYLLYIELILTTVLFLATTYSMYTLKSISNDFKLNI